VTDFAVWGGCTRCKHFCFDGTCLAFDPGQIPMPIASGELPHTTPVLGQANKIVYEYVAGENSLVNKVYKFDNITVENEYVLPHSTVARVKFGTMSSTIITHALPISQFKTKLFVKAYRSYWSSYHEKNTVYPFHLFESIINYLGDKVTYNTMFTTLKQDKEIVDNIDKTSYEGMHGKFSIVYDMFSNHYKNNYKMFYENQTFDLSTFEKG
jgi:hypothetical protein